MIGAKNDNSRENTILPNKENGYLIVEDALSRVEIDALLGEGVRICRGERGEVKG